MSPPPGNPPSPSTSLALPHPPPPIPLHLRLLHSTPSHAILFRADVEKARELFERAAAVNTGGISPVGVYGAYAKFLWATGGQRAVIIDMFEKACAAASTADAACVADAAAAADVMSSYASFLLTGGGAMTAKGEQLLRASLSLQVIAN